MTDQSPTLFLVGPGYSASRLAALCLDTGAWRVVGTARSEDKAAALREKGIEPVLTNDRDGLSQAAKASHWVISTPPGDEGCPGSKRGERRVLAEQQWLSVRRDTRLVRLPGIYGPGRSQLDRVREGKEEQIVKPGQVFSRIHVDDLANGLFALLQHPGLSGAFNLCDEEAAPPQDVMAYAADLLGMAMPVPVDLETADVSAMARSFYSECKRVSNARLKAATGWRPHYPTYREGLSAIFKAENN